MSQQVVQLNNGLLMPCVGVGTYLLKEAQVCRQIVREAIAVGYRLIDTAAVYQNESFIGQELKELFAGNHIKREELFITTKVGPRDQGKSKCRESVLRSLNNLQVEQLDLVLIHWPGTSGLQPQDPLHVQNRKESWEDLETLYREGKVRAIGVSNYNVGHVQELLDHSSIPPAVNQVEFHPLLAQKELLSFCKSKNIHVQAYSSLGSAKGRDILFSTPLLQEVAQRVDKSIPQVLLKWALQQGVSVIPKTGRVENLRHNFDLFSFDLNSQDMEAIQGLDRKQHFCWDPDTIR
jgi:diketogulonate reductase-like aldo/keto reductase